MQLVSNPKVNHPEPLSLQFVCNQVTTHCG